MPAEALGPAPVKSEEGTRSFRAFVMQKFNGRREFRMFDSFLEINHRTLIAHLRVVLNSFCALLLIVFLFVFVSVSLFLPSPPPIAAHFAPCASGPKEPLRYPGRSESEAVGGTEQAN